jgi:glycine betaine catabolism B
VKFIDQILNKITMYRLMVYVLGTFVSVGIVLSFMGHVSASPTSLVCSLFLILTAAYATDRIFGRLLHVPTNMESSLITSLILFLIMQPANSAVSGLTLALAGVVSSASKFIIAWKGKHIFNPAAFTAALMNLTGLQPTIWWVGGTLFAPFTFILGLAVVRKVRRFPLFLTFVGTTLIVQYVVFVSAHQSLATGMKYALISSPLIFLSTIMLLEPATMPPRRNLQMVFGALVAVLYVTVWQVGPLTIYPEVALLIGNVFAYLVSPKFRVRLVLKEVQQVSEHIRHYIFQPDRRLKFLPGQYMQWTLAGVPYDARGNRRTFTVASSPTEETVQLGLKFYEPASMFKASFERLQPGSVVYASQLAGNFTLEGNEQKKLAFVAGGIGVTPFRSIIKYLTDTNTQVDITLLYIVSNPQELAYMTEFKEAASVGIKTIPVVTDPKYNAPGTVNAKLTAELFTQLVPDYRERIFYISGPNAMVDAAKQYLYSVGVKRARIRTDHFSGY